MNFIFISPNFPHTYWNFCDRLKKNGVNVELRSGIQGSRVLLI